MKGWIPNYFSHKAKMDELKCISSIREYIHQSPFLFNQKTESEEEEKEESDALNPNAVDIKEKEKKESISKSNPHQKKEIPKIEKNNHENKELIPVIDEEELIIESNVSYSKVTRRVEDEDENEENIFDEEYLIQEKSGDQLEISTNQEDHEEEEEEENLDLDEIFPPNPFSSVINQSLENLIELSYGGNWKFVESKKNIEIYKMDIEGTSYTTVKGKKKKNNFQ
jgi:hypothetical protein